VRDRRRVQDGRRERPFLIAERRGSRGILMTTERSICETVVRQLWQYLDGTVPADKRELVEAHLEVCVRCASHFDFPRSFLEAGAAAPPSARVDETLHSRVVLALSKQGYTQPGTM